MKELFFKLLRDIRQSKGQFIAIILVLAVGAFFSTGLSTVSKSLRDYTNNYFKTNNLSDLNVYYSQISQDKINTLKKIKGINRIEGRYTFDATQMFGTLKTSLTVHSIPTNNEIDKLTIIKGSTPSNKDEILLDSHYAKEHNYHIGDNIKLNANKKNFKFKISGFCEDVEHAYNIKDPSLVIPDHKTYGVAYISSKRIPEISGSSYYNELIVDAKDGYDIDKIGNSIESKSKDLPYLYQLSKERTVSYTALYGSVKSNGVMGKVIPLIFFIVAAITTFLTISRIVDSQRNQIGIMKALGIKNSTIILHYIEYSILVGILGSIIGSILGIIIVPQIGSTNNQYSLPNYKTSIDFISIIPTVLLSIFFGVIASYLSCIKILKECAAQAMRPKPPKKSKRIFIERFAFIWKRLSYGNKIILRNIFLTKKRALCSSISIIICVILLIISFGYETSMRYVTKQLNEVYKYDLRIDYKYPITTNTLKLPSNVKRYYTLSELPVEFISSGNKKDMSVTVTKKGNNLINIYNEKNNKISLDNTGIIIPKSYADKYKLSKGDSIKLKFISPELKGKSVNMKISKISLQYIGGQSIYCTPKYLKSVGIKYNPTSLLVKVNNSSKFSKTHNFFKKEDSVDKVTDKGDLKKSVDNSVKGNNPACITLILCAIILSAASIFTMSSINIFERTRELATLKVLGYQKNKINRLVFIENIIITVFSVIIVLPLSIYIFKLFTKAMSSVDQLVPDKLDISAVALSILITFLVTIISNLLLRKKTAKIDMIESLKGVE
ncbi:MULTISPECIES: ABC transporter permease [Clostridium]|uniref:ABC transporter permease n=1 Tax=Clostridium TaxID=1485 RepID=UPI000825E30B|nr:MULTISPECIES: ABC transporter permease [Clostridium]PJI09449.1 ABC transporter permease [Clostridium sp. CT7]